MVSGQDGSMKGLLLPPRQSDPVGPTTNSCVTRRNILPLSGQGDKHERSAAA